MTSKTWSLPIDLEGNISFPEDLVKVMGWDEGTVLSWDVDKSGTIKVRAVTDDSSDTTSPESES